MRTTLRARGTVAVLVPIALLLALLAWGVSSPPGSSPDDDYHMASVWCATGPADDLCETTSDPEVRSLPADVLTAAGCFAFRAEQAASCALDEDSMGTSARGNWNGGAYPGLFYNVMRVFAGEDLSVSIVLMRSFNALLYVGVLTSLFFLLPAARRHVLLWGAALTAVPLGVFLLPSVNPSSWAVISATGLWIAAWGFFEQRGARKVLLGVMTVLLLILGAGARSDSAVYGVLALIAASVLAFRRDRRYLLDLILPVGLTLVAVGFFFSGGQSAIVGGATAVENTTYSFSALLFLDAKGLPNLLAGVFGTWGLGWLDTIMPGIVTVTTMSVFAAVVFWGLHRAGARKWIALAGIALCIVAVPMYILLHDGVVVGAGVQPRYIYPLIIIFGGLAVVGLRRGSLGLGRVQLLVVGVGLAVANSVALHTNLRRYVTGIDMPGVNLDRDIEWWWNAPVSPMGVWALGSLAAALIVAALVWAVWPTHAAAERVLEPEKEAADRV